MARTSTFPKAGPDENEEADARDYSTMIQPRTMENSSGRIPPSFPPYEPPSQLEEDPRFAIIKQMMEAQYRGGGARNPPDPDALELLRQGSRGAGDAGRTMLRPDERMLDHINKNIGGKQSESVDDNDDDKKNKMNGSRR